ncbi:MAG: RAMP superfamily CRISPR-associated protein [Bacteroidia bacterium]|nr:RAMP superfamily CRISPR-associated protein [Bacteroidia bacterium]MDW8159462.1 RAMP superfamily CRISPR-associated protein [Bacteroidia bacterium]
MNLSTSNSTIQEYAQNNQNRIYHIALETLSPLHISTVDEKKWHRGMNYLCKGSKIYIIDENKLLPILARNYGFSLEFSDIANFLDRVAEKKVANLSLEDISYFVSRLKYSNQEPIRPMITTGLDVPYIPGSSLKGAIRSVLFKAWYKKVYSKSIDPKPRSKELEEKLFGKIQNNLMKFLIVGDTHFNWEETELYNSKIFNVYNSGREWVSGWKHGRKGNNDSKFNEKDFTTALHCIQPKKKGVLQIAVNKNLLKMGLEKTIKGKKIEFTPTLKGSYLESSEPLFELFRLINSHTRAYLQKELNFYKTFTGADYHQDLVEYVQNLLSHVSKIENQKKAVIRLGFGSGFHSITGDWQFEDHTLPIKQNKEKKYKTRRWLFSNFDNKLEFYLPGFVELSILEDPKQAVALRERIVLPKRIAQIVQIQDTETPTSTAASPPPVELAPLPYKGRLRQGAKDIPAKVISQSGREVVFELLLEGGNQQAKGSYSSRLEIGSWHYVSIKALDNKGNVQRVEYQRRFS